MTDAIERIVLEDEDGNEVEFEVWHMIEIDGKQYARLVPLEDVAIDDEEEGLLYGWFLIETDAEGEPFLTLVDYDEWDGLEEALREMQED